MPQLNISRAAAKTGHSQIINKTIRLFFFNFEKQQELSCISAAVSQAVAKFLIRIFSCPITSWQIDGETMETVRDFILGAPKSLQMVTAAMKLKDA